MKLQENWAFKTEKKQGESLSQARHLQRHIRIHDQKQWDVACLFMWDFDSNGNGVSQVLCP